jgi:ketose-bisphosphate aldolase
MNTAECMLRAWRKGVVVPAFNVPHLPMMAPIVQAVAEERSFALVEVAYLEFAKFTAGSARKVYEIYDGLRDPDHVRLHLDHAPVVDEDGVRVDFRALVREALDLGYESVMVDASRLPLDENIRATRQVVEIAHVAGAPCEAELGAVLGHESGSLPSYEEIFATRRGFTDPAEAARFVRETGCDWLSVAFGSIHGAVSVALRDRRKPEARLDIDHLRVLREATGIPLVLHGGSGVRHECVLEAVRAGIAKVNVGTELRQAYETALKDHGSIDAAREAVRKKTAGLLRDYFQISGSAALVTGPA